MTSVDGVKSNAHAFMDFWSNADNSVILTAGGEAGVFALPDIVVSGIPTNATITRVVAMLKISLIRDTSTADNAVDVATGHVEIQKGGAGGYTTAIDIPDNSWYVDVSTSPDRGGDVLVGDRDIKAVVTGDDTYNAELDDIGVDGDNLQLHDVMVGLRVYFRT